MESLNESLQSRRKANEPFSSYHLNILNYSDPEIIFRDKFCNKFSYNEISLNFINPRNHIGFLYIHEEITEMVSITNDRNEVQEINRITESRKDEEAKFERLNIINFQEDFLNYQLSFEQFLMGINVCKYLYNNLHDLHMETDFIKTLNSFS